MWYNSGMFYGREDILADLSELWRKSAASLVTCRGRRRIGKSTLVGEFARRSGARFIKLEGKAPEPKMSNDDQLASFQAQLKPYARRRRLDCSSWLEAFRALDGILDDRKTVLLLDEISWMGKYDSGFPGDLKIAWDNLFRCHDHLIVFLCGSVSTWIDDNILHNTGFVGRRSMDFVLGELPLRDCVRFWRDRADRVSPREIADVLSVTGGVPKYLEGVDPSLSADENVRRMCFRPNGVLVHDFDEIFSDLFQSDAADKREMLSALSAGPLGVSEIARKLGKGKNGHLSKALETLEVSGFVEREVGLNPQTEEPVQQVRYRLKDNYARFFLKYVKPRLPLIDRDGYRFSSLEQLDGWPSILGLQFENLILNHLSDLLPLLHIERTLITSAAPYRKSARNGNGGCQIDLLIQSKHFKYVVEIKRRREIGTEVVDEVRDKVARLGLKRSDTVRTALVYEGRLSPKVEGDGYFDAVVPIEKLFAASAR